MLMIIKLKLSIFYLIEVIMTKMASCKITHCIWVALICVLLIVSILPTKEQSTVIIYDKISQNGLCIISFQINGRNVSAIRTYHAYSIKTDNGKFSFSVTDNNGNSKIDNVSKKDIVKNRYSLLNLPIPMASK